MSAFRDPIAWEETLPVRPSSPAWRALLRGFYGSDLSPAEMTLWQEITGTEAPPAGGYVELLVVAGRRGGKSETIARVAIFEALHGGHGVALAPGQIGLVVVISPLREQSGEIIRYVKGLAGLPTLKRHVTAETTDSVTFRTGIRVQVMTADAVNVSGPTVVVAIRDEWAKFPGDDSAMPDRETENSLRPALAPVEGAPPRRLIGITSAYIRDGLAFETDRDHFGKPDAPVLVARGSTETFNPNINRAWLARERKRVGPAVFAREYEGQWVDAVTDGWFGASLDDCIDRDTTSRPRVDGTRYTIAIDPAFAGDSFAVAVAHAEPRRGLPPLLVQDFAHAWKPRMAGSQGRISVEAVAVKIAALCETYGTHHVFVDQHGGEPLRAVFARRGVNLIERPWTAASKAPTFRLIRDAMTDERVRLLDVPEQTREFHAIRGELLRSGTERIEAAFGHDDRVSAAVMALHEAGRFGAVVSHGTTRAPREALAALRSSWDGGGAPTTDTNTGLRRLTMFPPADRDRPDRGSWE